jgi:hypothetical protein
MTNLELIDFTELNDPGLNFENAYRLIEYVIDEMYGAYGFACRRSFIHLNYKLKVKNALDNHDIDGVKSASLEYVDKTLDFLVKN